MAWKEDHVKFAQSQKKSTVSELILSMSSVDFVCINIIISPRRSLEDTGSRARFTCLDLQKLPSECAQSKKPSKVAELIPKIFV